MVATNNQRGPTIGGFSTFLFVCVVLSQQILVWLIGCINTKKNQVFLVSIFNESIYFCWKKCGYFWHPLTDSGFFCKIFLVWSHCWGEKNQRVSVFWVRHTLPISNLSWNVPKHHIDLVVGTGNEENDQHLGVPSRCCEQKKRWCFSRLLEWVD